MKKPEIKLNQDPLSKTEIESKMNFDKFLSGHAAASHVSWLSKTAKIYLSVSASVVVVAGLSYMVYKNKSATADSASEKFINPPVADLLVKPDNFLIDTQKDTTITLENGSSVFVPAGSFVTKDGKDVDGKIELSYREFHDQVDLIFSGIPMNYDSAGVKYQFESAGMFEIKAYKNGELLGLKQGKEITVNMISYNEGNYFNVYYLDTVQKKWVYNESNTRTCKEKIAGVWDEKIITSDVRIEPEKLIVPKRANPDLYNFIIDYNKEEFPELAVYEGVKFEVPKEDKNFDVKFAKIVWDDVVIRRHNETQYSVTFKYGKKSAGFLTTPVLDEEDFDAAMKEYEKRRKEHLVAERRKNDSLNVTNVNFTRQANANNNINARFDRAVLQGTVYRSIVVSNMGIWNCDHPFRFVLQERNEKEQKIGFPTAAFESDNGEKMEMKKLFLVKRSTNAIYPLSEKEFKRFPVSIAKTADIMMGVTGADEVVYLENVELKNMSITGDNIIIKMHQISYYNNNLKGIKAMLKI